jgi:hypothetical protein
MKINYIHTVALVLIVSASISCKKDADPIPEPTPTEAEKVTTLLTATGGKWNPAPLANWVMVEGVNVSDLFKDFTISFTATGFTTSGTTPVWPRTDTWHFKDETAKILIRDSDKKEVTIESVNATTLRITLTWDKTTYGGRTTSISGKHEFNLTK